MFDGLWGPWYRCWHWTRACYHRLIERDTDRAHRRDRRAQLRGDVLLKVLGIDRRGRELGNHQITWEFSGSTAGHLFFWVAEMGDSPPLNMKKGEFLWFTNLFFQRSTLQHGGDHVAFPCFSFPEGWLFGLPGLSFFVAHPCCPCFLSAAASCSHVKGDDSVHHGFLRMKCLRWTPASWSARSLRPTDPRTHRPSSATAFYRLVSSFRKGSMKSKPRVFGGRAFFGCDFREDEL